ncbi:hypothetical protein BpHYR1_048174 [Brachionus plicatilis]|uniref:Uncharacterized protein n=1 Tax=Brachionus plicatilis TaxID=10195 RepID=A0A3M7QG22_BRAPC|nr:hypothetical protein BpHYR1_048174 [Brachionus plicatilis]
MTCQTSDQNLFREERPGRIDPNLKSKENVTNATEFFVHTTKYNKLLFGKCKTSTLSEDSIFFRKKIFGARGLKTQEHKQGSMSSERFFVSCPRITTQSLIKYIYSETRKNSGKIQVVRLKKLAKNNKVPKFYYLKFKLKKNIDNLK